MSDGSSSVIIVVVVVVAAVVVVVVVVVVIVIVRRIIVIIKVLIITVKLLTGPSLRVFKVINWAKSKLLTGPRSFPHNKNRGFRRFFAQLSLCVCVCVCVCFLFPIIWQFSIFFCFKKRVQKMGFSIFCVLRLNFEFFGLLKHYKIGVSANCGVFCC